MFVFVFVRQSDSFITVIAARNGALAKIRITIHSHIVSRTSFFPSQFPGDGLIGRNLPMLHNFP